MPIPQAARRPTRMRRVWPALALLGLLGAATGAAADVIKKEDMLRGVTITRPQCAAIEQAVWVSVSGHDFCVRYYLSTAGGEGTRPVVFIQGDYFGRLDPKTWSWVDPSDARDINTDDLVRMADGFSKLAKTTAIYLGRIGVEGTSGNHTARKTVLELRMMNAALDAIKQRYGFEGFHLAGQSGGSKLVGGLVEQRHDIACAVAGSGPLATPGGGPKPSDPGRSFFRRDAERAAGGAEPLAPPAAGERSGGQAGPDRPADRLRRPHAPGRPADPPVPGRGDRRGASRGGGLFRAGRGRLRPGKTDQEMRARSAPSSSAASSTTRAGSGSQSKPGIAAAAARQPVVEARGAPGGA